MSTDQTANAFKFLRDAHGLHDDPDLLKLFDLDAFEKNPHAFALACKAQVPSAFRGGHFDARTASEAEVKARLRDIERDSRARRDAAKTEAIGDVRGMSASEWAAARKKIR